MINPFKKTMTDIRPFEREAFNYAYLGDHKAVVVTYFGARMLIDTRNIQHLRLITHGCFEKGVSWAIEDNIGEGQTMIDVGANLGFFTLLGCHKVGPKGKVIAFEPNPVIFDMMQKSVFANSYRPRSERHNVAAFNQDGTMEFTWGTHDHGGGRLITPDLRRMSDNKAEVKTARLDDLIDPDHFPISLIKIDTEGAEPYVLEGAENTLKQNPNCTVITEWVPGFIRDRSYPLDKAIEFIDAHFNSIEKIDGIGKATRLSIDDLRKKQRFDLILRR